MNLTTTYILQVVRAVRESVRIPVAVKLSPFYSSLAHYARKLDEMRGSMSLERCPDPRAYERANYMKILQSWSPQL
jgi:hypothetical protein